MKRCFLFSAFVVPRLFCHASGGDFAVSKISADLLKNANVVKRLEEKTFELKNAGEAYYTEHYVVTIMNENGEKYADFVQGYNKFIEIRSISGALYDASGKELKRIKARDLQDVSGTGDQSLIDDTRYKVFQFYYRSYPYTVEYSVELKYNGTMFYPYWQPCQNEKFAVEESRFTFSCPLDYEFRYRAFHYNGDPVIQNTRDKKVYTWEVKQLPAFMEEPFAPDFKKLTTFVAFGPTDFEMLDYKGTMKTWQDLGKFIYSLRQGRDALPDPIRQKVHQLTDRVKDPKEKIRLLYEFMQSSTRYISIQLGIGSWQPFDAQYVSSKGFGDCKALSNYMYSLLKEIDIKSFYTVINAGEEAEEVITDFPSPRFDHVILFVPVQKDTVWLECTSQTLPAGYLGTFTCNRYALAVDENGGTLVHTPKYDIRENTEVRNTKAKLDVDGTLSVQAFTRYGGLQQDELHGIINNLSKDKVKEILNEELDFATYDVDKFDYRQMKGWKPSIEEKLEITANNYATVTGKRLFIVPNVMTRSHEKLKADEQRKYDIELTQEYRDIDTSEIEIPSGYDPESIPQPVNLETKFGKYSSAVRLVGNTIFYYRNREQYSGTFPAKDYADLVNYYDAVYKADRSKIVLVKKEGN